MPRAPRRENEPTILTHTDSTVNATLLLQYSVHECEQLSCLCTDLKLRMQ